MSKSKSVVERHIRVYASLYDAPAFRSLPFSALKLWVDLRTKNNGSNNGNISAALSTLRYRDWNSADTLNKALWKLLDRGLLRRTREGQPGPFRICALYAFTDLPTVRNDKLEIEGRQATREFAEWVPGKSFAPEKRARKVPANPNKKNPLFQKSGGYRSDDRSVTASTTGE